MEVRVSKRSQTRKESIQVTEDVISSSTTESLELDSVEAQKDPGFHDPYEDMPSLQESPINPHGPIHKSDKNAESIFVTLGRYAFPRTKESLLPGLSLQTIYNKTKHLVLRWSESPDHSLTDDEKEFFDSLFSKGVHTVDMSDWEYLRDTFIVRDEWFTIQRDGRNFRAYKVTVKELPPGVQLFKYLPPCRTSSAAKASIGRYTCVVNLGRRVDLSESKGYKRSPQFVHEGPELTMVSVEPSDNGHTSLGRSARLRKGSHSIYDALKYEFDNTSNGPELSRLEDEDWSFDVYQQGDSGFDDNHTDQETSIFQPGVPMPPFESFFLENFQYPAEQVTLENGLTISEELAFSDLEDQLTTFYNLKPKIKRFKKKSTCSTEASTRAQKKSALPTRYSARLASNTVDSLFFRRNSFASSGSESTGLEIISAEKAILTALKVPSEYASFPTPKFVLEHAGQYIRDSDFIIQYDPDIPQPVESSMTPEEPSLPLPAEEAIESQSIECLKEFCLLGCVCKCIQGEVVVRDHCGKIKCQLGCACGVKPVKIETHDKGIRDIRSRLRPRSRKWKKSNHTFSATKRHKTAGKRDSGTDNEDVPMKRRKLLTGIMESTTMGEPDCEDSYMGDIDMAETSSSDSTGSFSSPSSPPVTVITIDSEDGAYVDENKSELGEEDPVATFELAERRASRQRKKHGCQPCLVRTVEANLNLPLDKIEALCVPRVNYAEDIGDTQKIVRRLYMPLQLEMMEEQDNDRTIVNVAENHKAIVNWKSSCRIPRASKTAVSVPPSVVLQTVITLPIPHLNETFFLFKIPPETDGDVLLHVHDMQFMLPLDALQDVRLIGNKKVTRRVQLVDRDQKFIRDPTGHPCEVFLFPTLPSILVFGPFPVAPPAGPFIRESSITKHESWNPEPGTLIPTPIPGVNWTISNGEEIGIYSDCNGDGELIPRDYYKNVFQDFMIQFPEMDDYTIDG